MTCSALAAGPPFRENVRRRFFPSLWVGPGSRGASAKPVPGCSGHVTCSHSFPVGPALPSHRFILNLAKGAGFNYVPPELLATCELKAAVGVS